MKKAFFKKAGLVALISFCTLQANAEHEFVPGQYIVKLKAQASKIQSSDLEHILGAKIIQKLSEESQSILVQRSEVELKTFAIQQMQESALVEYAEPNYIYRHFATPNDAEYAQLWGMNNTGQKDPAGVVGRAGIDINAEKAWDITTGSKDVIVAVIDTGVVYNNPDLKDNMWQNPNEIAGNGIDDDKNGYVDDVYGIDPANRDGDPLDDHGHGTHVAGTIGASGNNASSVVGVAWNVRIMAIKFLTAQGSGNTANAILGIDYAVNNGAKILNNSWGGGAFSQALADAIQRAADKNVLFVAAAGNSSSNNDSDPTYPATYDKANIVSVAAFTNQAELANFSCYGKKTVHIAAPGKNILSTTTDGLKSWSGTSMASPHIAGVAALLLSHEPDLSALDLKARMLTTARPMTSLRGRVATGLVDAHAALTNTIPEPDQDDPANWKSVEKILSSEHPYPNKANISYEISVPGASQIAIKFDKFEFEKNYDYVNIYDKNNVLIVKLTGKFNESLSPNIIGDSARLELVSDTSVNQYGFDITKVHYKE